MQGVEDAYTSEEIQFLNQCWIADRDAAVITVKSYQNAFNVAKQDVNRLLEPWMWVTQVITSTDWANFFALRNHPMAHPAIRRIAEMMYREYQESTPALLNFGKWHLPYVTPEDRLNPELEKDLGVIDVFRLPESWPVMYTPYQMVNLIALSVVQCARTSYTKMGSDLSLPDMVTRFNDLISQTPKHASPLEHQATPSDARAVTLKGNLRHWYQFRHFVPGESVADELYDGSTRDYKELSEC